MSGAFDLLHPALQRRLYEMGWPRLYPIQVQAIQHLLGPGGDCVIASATAGGKTEAAFLPVLSKVAEAPSDGIRAMYVGPLKALINDQFRRLEDLCSRLEVPVHKWHGDVGQTARTAVLGKPAGVLLITPESLEAMFVLRPTHIARLFSKLGYVVIDELHAFLGSVRGCQLLSLLHRLGLRAGCQPTRIGLSATLGDLGGACRWIRPAGPPATLILDAAASRGLKIRARGFWRRASDEEGEDPVLQEVARSLLLSSRGGTNLVFANAKGRIEEVADALKQVGAELRVEDEVVVHHGSLSREEREAVEARLRDPRPCTAVCSNTLELGIDIGEVDEVVQVSAPWSVASLIQRVGRSGRREGKASVLRAVFVEEPADDQDVWNRLHVDFLQGLAIIELMIEKFVEPGDAGRTHLSTLVHQLLSSLAETGGIPARALFERLLPSRAFGDVSPAEFGQLLRALAARDLVQQMDGGDLILGVRGQRLVDHFSFYAAFQTPREMQVVHGSRILGTLPADLVPAVGDHLLFAGRRWLVEGLEAEAGVVRVVPSKGRRPPRFHIFAGDIHRKVHERMYDLLCSSAVNPILDTVASEILREARTAAARHGGLEPRLQAKGDSSTLLFAFAGSKVQRTLQLVLFDAGLRADDRRIGLEVAASEEQTRSALRAWFSAPADGVRLARVADERLAARTMNAEKHDEVLPFELWARVFAADRLDLDGARAWVAERVPS